MKKICKSQTGTARSSKSAAAGMVGLSMIALCVTGNAGAESAIDVQINDSTIVYNTNTVHDGAVLTLSGDGYDWVHEFNAGDTISIGVYDDDGELLYDGVYNWRLELYPEPGVSATLAIASSLANSEGGEAIEWPIYSGSIAVSNGQFVSDAVAEAGADRDNSITGGASHADRKSPEDDDGS